MKKEYRTKYKDSIMDYLKLNKNVRFCAADVFKYMNDKGISINITTVYRNLDKMTENGVLLRSKNPTDECCFYQYTEPESHCEGHLHIQCKKCGRIIHLKGSFMNEFNNYVKLSYGFMLDYKASMIIGLCDNCRGAEIR